METLRRDARRLRREHLEEPEDVRRPAPPSPVVAALSLLPGLVALVLVQAAGPAGQQVPAGPARFDLAAAWLTGEPGALAGAAPHPALIGRVQLGLLLRAAQTLQSSSVLSAAQLVLLVLAVVQALLVWLLLRRLGCGPVPAGLAVAVLGVAPAAVLAHGGVSAAGVAAVWLLLAALLVDRQHPAASAAAGAAAVLGVLAFPPALLPALVLAAAVRRRVRPVPVGAGAAAAVLVVAALATAAALQTATDASRALDAVGAAQPLLTGGAASLATWATTDPLGLLIGVVAVVAASLGRPALGVAAAVVAAASLWPLGADPVGPLVLLLVLSGVAVGLTAERAVHALLQPVFRRSLVGSGWLMGVGGLLLVSVVVALTGLPSLVPGADRPMARAQRWLAGSVPAGQTVLVGLGAWPDLRRASSAAVGWYAARPGATAVPSSEPWSAADYVVADPSLDGIRSPAVRAALARSVPVARFGAGEERLVVRALRAPTASSSPSPSSTAPSTAAERRARQARISTGRQLAANARIELTGEDRALLTGGDVDQRIALVLAQLATEHRVAVASFGTAAGDSSGVRTTVLISAVDGRRVPADVQRTGDLLRFLSALRDDFATRSIDASADGVTASFSPDPDFESSS